MTATGFDTARYVESQTARIQERLAHFGTRLYLEFDGFVDRDRHAERVLPGFDPDSKLQVMRGLGDQLEVLICVNARALATEDRLQASLGAGRTADLVVLQAVDGWTSFGVDACAVVINRFDGQREARNLRDQLEVLGVRVYTQPELPSLPADLDRVVGAQGWGRFPSIATRRPIVLVTGLGREAGKHTTCLSLLYKDRCAGLRSGYARWVTFPVPTLPVGHPLHAAFEAASADEDNRTVVDPHHLEATGETAITTSRELTHHGLIRRVLERIVEPGDSMADFPSPTALGVNACRDGIVEGAEVEEAARHEIVRRWYRYHEGIVVGSVDPDVSERMDRILHDQGLGVADREVVVPARRAAAAARLRGKGHKGVYCGAAIQLPDGHIVEGSNSDLLHAASAVLIRALKAVAGIDEEQVLLSDATVERIRAMKHAAMDDPFGSLSLDETLIALSLADSDAVARALEALPGLRGCEMHMTHMPPPGDASGLRKVGLYYTTDGRLSFGERRI